MKKIILLVTLACSLVLSSVAFAGGSSSAGTGNIHGKRDVSQEILNHPAVLAVERLLNEKYGNQCVIPTADKDIRWMCTGALPLVKTPTIVPTGCGFALFVDCPREAVRIVGSTLSYLLVAPSGTDTSVSPTSGIILINNVNFQSKE